MTAASLKKQQCPVDFSHISSIPLFFIVHFFVLLTPLAPVESTEHNIHILMAELSVIHMLISHCIGDLKILLGI